MTGSGSLDLVERRGWEVVVMRSPDLEVHCLPGRGCDLLSVRPTGGPELLWSTPWGLRARGAASGGGDDRTLLMEQYPGGWQTVFPNAGPARDVHDAPWGMHGEAWLAPFVLTASERTADGAWLEAETRLVRSPFRLAKRVEVSGPSVTVTEAATNEGGHPVSVMWSQHPAFSPAVLGPRAELSTSARQVVVDPDRDTPTGDLRPGATSSWPYAIGKHGDPVDLRPVPPDTSKVDRLLYLTGFPEPVPPESEGTAWVRLVDPEAELGVTLRWDAEAMPHAWYWLESYATPGFPWYAGVRTLALEPATSWPAARDSGAPATGGTITIGPGERRTHRVVLSVEHERPSTTERSLAPLDER